MLFLVETKLSSEELRGGLERAEERWESDELRPREATDIEGDKEKKRKRT